MYITVSLLNQKLKKQLNRHHNSILKQIQYTDICKKIEQDENLKIKNGLINPTYLTARRRSTLYYSKITLNSNRASQACIRRHNKYLSDFSNMFQRTQNIFQQQDNKNNEINQQNPKQLITIKQNQNSKINQRKQSLISTNKQNLINKAKKSIRPSTSHGFYNKIKSNQPISKKTLKKKMFTTVDIKVKDIQQLIKKIEKQKTENFTNDVEKDQNNIKTKGWNKFFTQLQKNKSKDQRIMTKDQKIMTKFTQVRKIATSFKNHPQQQVQKQNRKIFCEQKQLIIPKRPLTTQNNYLFNRSKDSYAHNLQKQNISDLLNFVKGQQQNQFSKVLSLKNYQNDHKQFYTLRNVQKSIKNSNKFKTIKIVDYDQYQKGDAIKFIYLKNNSYRFHTKQSQHVFNDNDIVP